MASAKIRPQKMGFVGLDSGGQIPIYGIESLSFQRISSWNISGIGPSAAYIVDWQGTEIISIPINFELVAGISVDKREDLFDHMKTAHAMVAHQSKDDGSAGAKPPPLCVLAIGKYVNAKGIMRDFTAQPSGPWGNDGSESDISSMYPTSVRFSGNFLVVPGYDSNKGIVQVNSQNQLTDSKSVGERFYKF